MSLSPPKRGAGATPVSLELTRLERLLAGATREYGAAEVTHAMCYYLWPELASWSAATVPEALRRFVARHLLAAGVGPATPPDVAEERVAAFFVRFPPAPALLSELEDFALWLVGNDRERTRSDAARSLGGSPRPGTRPDGDTVSSSEVLVGKLRDVRLPGRRSND